MTGPLGRIMTVNPGPVMPQVQAPRQYVGTPFIDANIRGNQEVRAQQDQDMQVAKSNFDINRTNADIANKQAFSSGLGDIVADPGMSEPEQQQKIGLLAANTGQSDITMKMQDQEYQRQTKMEAQVMELAGAGNVAAAKHLAQQHGIKIPDEVLNDGVLTKGFSIGVKLYDYDPRQAGVFATEYRRTGGDYNAALQLAGEPRRKPVTGSYTPMNVIDESGNPKTVRFNKNDGVVEEIPGYQSFTKPSARAPGAVGKLTAYEVKVKMFEDAYKGDYPNPSELRKAAIQHIDGGKPLDPARARQAAMKMVTEQETLSGSQLYKTQEEREAAADAVVAYALGNGATGNTASPPLSTTPGASSRAPTTVPVDTPPPPGFELD
jgi:hypothetical protein